MQEIFPVVCGALIGAGAQRLLSGRLRWVAMVALSIVAGVAASTISGELELSWGFVPIDLLQALIAAVVTAGLFTLWERRAAQTR